MAENAAATGENKTQRVVVIIAKDNMSATIMAKAPLDSEPEPTLEELQKELVAAGINYGIDKKALERIINGKIYNKPVKVASGLAPQRGDHASFTYHFDTVRELHPTEDEVGHIDYKNIHFIQNIDSGAVLVTKTPPQQGKPGKDIFGKGITAQDGKDIAFKNGKNTEISEDGFSLVALKSGAIVYLNGIVAVDDVMVIKGNVDFNVGNIDCKASVKVMYDIKTGFQIKTDANLEVMGNVEDALIEVKGDVMIKGGYYGKRNGYLKADGDIYLKYAENQRIMAGGDIHVGGELINCDVTAEGNVYVNGRRGKIIGGEVRARSEVHAGEMGNDTGTQTIVHVAYNPELYQRRDAIEEEIERLQDDLKRINAALKELQKQNIERKLMPQQQLVVKQFEEFKTNLPPKMESLKAQLKEVNDEIQLTESSRVIVEDRAYCGVRVCFGPLYHNVNEELRKVQFTTDLKEVYVSDYTPNAD